MSSTKIYIFTIIAILGICINSYAQQKELVNIGEHFPEFDKEWIQTSVGCNDGSIIAVGQYSPTPSSDTKGIIIKLDESGELLMYRDDFGIDLYGFSDIVKHPTTSNFFTAACFSTGETVAIAVFEITPELGIVNVGYYFPEEYYSLLIRILIDNNRLYLYGHTDLNPPTLPAHINPYCISTNLELDTTYASTLVYLYDSGWNGCYRMLPSKNPGNLYLFVPRFPLVENSPSASDKALVALEMNNNLEVIDTIVINSFITNENDACYFQNKLIVNGYIRLMVQNDITYKYYSTMIKYIDTTDFHYTDSLYFGSLQQDSACSQPWYGSIAVNNDKCYFTILNPARSVFFSPAGSVNNIGLRCINSEFEIEWEKYYTYDDHALWMSHIAPLADGKIAISGLAHHIDDTGSDTDFMMIIVDEDGMLPVEDSPFTASETMAYPNPAINELTVCVGIQHKECHILLYNMEGKLLLQQPIPENQTTIDVSHFKSGNYIYKVYNNNGFEESGKFIKQ